MIFHLYFYMFYDISLWQIEAVSKDKNEFYQNAERIYPYFIYFLFPHLSKSLKSR